MTNNVGHYLFSKQLIVQINVVMSAYFDVDVVTECRPAIYMIYMDCRVTHRMEARVRSTPYY